MTVERASQSGDKPTKKALYRAERPMTRVSIFGSARKAAAESKARDKKKVAAKEAAAAVLPSAATMAEAGLSGFSSPFTLRKPFADGTVFSGPPLDGLELVFPASPYSPATHRSFSRSLRGTATPMPRSSTAGRKCSCRAGGARQERASVENRPRSLLGWALLYRGPRRPRCSAT